MPRKAQKAQTITQKSYVLSVPFCGLLAVDVIVLAVEYAPAVSFCCHLVSGASDERSERCNRYHLLPQLEPQFK